MSVTIGGIVFERHSYDARADVLYLGIDGYEGPPASALSTPEGHNVEYDSEDRVIGITFVNVRRLLDRDGGMTIAWSARIAEDRLAPVLDERNPDGVAGLPPRRDFDNRRKRTCSGS